MPSIAMASASGPNGTDTDYSYSEDGTASASASSGNASSGKGAAGSRASSRSKSFAFGSSGATSSANDMAGIYANKLATNQSDGNASADGMVRLLGQLIQSLGIDKQKGEQLLQMFAQAMANRANKS